MRRTGIRWRALADLIDMIETNSEPKRAWNALETALENYRFMLSRFEGDVVKERRQQSISRKADLLGDLPKCRGVRLPANS